MIDTLHGIEPVSNTLRSIPAGNILAIRLLGMPRRHHYHELGGDLEREITR